MKAIAAVDKNLAIGREGQLLFRIPGDLKHFKKETIEGICIMGRKTLESMPGGKPLPGRHTFVLSRSMEEGIWYCKSGNTVWLFGVFSDVQKLLEFLDRGGKTIPEAAVCGGGQIYEALLPYCDELVLTEVDAAAENPDAYFPNFQSSGEFALSSAGEETSENGYTYRINRYTRVR